MPHSGGNLYIKTFGCQMNAYDSLKIAELLGRSHGMTTVDDPSVADCVIFNTCHIREKAEEKLFSELGRLRKLASHRKQVIAVGGCVGQAVGREIFRRAPYVDLVFGPQNYHHLPELLERVRNGESRLLDDSIPPEPKFDQLPELTTPGPVAAVAVQEGCDKFCSYCVVPFTRGREWSRPVAEVVDEITGLAARGVKEVLLLGQNVNGYRGVDSDGVGFDLALLIRRVALIAGIERIRFTTSHPADMNRDLIEVFAEVPQLCPYLHLPIQSGSDAVLARMGRGHTVDEYVAWIDQLRAVCPEVTVASDFIVGFPGESDADFEQTLELVRRIDYDHAFSFKFSARPGTAAAELDGAVSDELATERLFRLQELLNARQLANNRRQVGRVEQVLVEGRAKLDGNELSGRTPGWRKVNFPGSDELIGGIVAVEITAGLPNSLRGRLVPPVGG